MKSANEIWRTYVKQTGTPFANWLNWENHKFDERQPKVEFIVWLNNKYRLMKDQAWLHYKDERVQFYADNSKQTNPVKKNNYKYVFIGIGILVVGTIIYYAVRKNENKNRS